MELARPNLTIYREKDYPDGTVGDKVFPPRLDGRLRLADPLFGSPARLIIDPQRDEKLKMLEIEETRDLLRASYARVVDVFENPNVLINRLIGLLNIVLWSPGDKFMAYVFGYHPLHDIDKVLTTNPSLEADRGMAISRSLTQLNLNQHAAVDLSLGLTDYHPKKIEDIAGYLGISSRDTNIVLSQGLMKLRRQSRRYLKQYLPPED